MASTMLLPPMPSPCCFASKGSGGSICSSSKGSISVQPLDHRRSKAGIAPSTASRPHATAIRLAPLNSRSSAALLDRSGAGVSLGSVHGSTGRLGRRSSSSSANGGRRGMMVTAIAGDGTKSNGRFYFNVTGFPFPLGPFLSRRTFRTEVNNMLTRTCVLSVRESVYCECEINHRIFSFKRPFGRFTSGSLSCFTEPVT